MEFSKTRLIVKPVQGRSYQNRHLQEVVYRTQDGQIVESKGMNKNKAVTPSGESCIDSLVFRRDASGTRFNAGLGEQVVNPWFIGRVEEDELIEHVESIFSNYKLPQSWRNKIEKIVKQKQISKQQELEIKAGVEPGTYTDLLPKRIQGSMFFDPEDKTELSQFKLVLYDRSNIFTDETPRQRLAIQLIKNRPDRIAPSLKDVNSATHTFYIAEEQEEFKISKGKNDLINEAIFELVSITKQYPLTSELEESVLFQITSLLTDRENRVVIKGRVTNLFVEQQINSYIKDKGTGQLENVTKFLEVIKLFKSNPDLFYAKYIVQQAFNTRVVSDENGYVFWHSMKHRPEWYKFSSRQKLESFIYTEMEKYNPDEPLIENGYKEFIALVEDRGGVVPKSLK